MATVTTGVTASERLAHWATNYDIATAPAEAMTLSRRYMLDAIGCGLAALDDRVAASAHSLAGLLGAGDRTVIGTSKRLSPPDAAFINGTIMHALDYDDASFGGHATGCILPAVLALGEAERASGDEIMAAYTVGMETFGRLALDALPAYMLHGLGWHPTSVFGILASAVGSSRILGLTAEQTMNAIGLAASFGAGLTSNFGTMTKSTHSGHSARSGALAAMMAQQGFTASPTSLESPHGFAQAYARGEGRWEAFCENLGNPLRITFRPPSIKQYPCCGGNHRAVQALLEMKARHSLTADNVAEVEVHVTPELLIVLSYSHPVDEYQAKFSLEFNLATALVDGKPQVASYADENVLRLSSVMASKIRVIGDLEEEPVPGSPVPPVACRLKVTTTDGTVYEDQPSSVHGSPADPMTEEEIVAKFVENGTPSFGVDRATELSKAILGLGSDSEAFWDAWHSLDREVK